MDKVREEFEKFLYSRLGCDVVDLSKDGGGVYNSYETGNYYVVWLESRKRINIQLPENCKGNALTVSELKEQLDKEGIKYDF